MAVRNGLRDVCGGRRDKCLVEIARRRFEIALGRFEHRDMGVEAVCLALAAIGQVIVDLRGNKTKAHDKQRDRSHRHGHFIRRHQSAVIQDRGIGNDRDRAHADEMHAANRERPEQCTQHAATDVADGDRRQRARYHEHHADDDGGSDIVAIPMQAERTLKAGHAGVMHSAYRQSADAAAQERRFRPQILGETQRGKRECGKDNRQDHRSNRQRQIEAKRHDAAKGEHAHEMRGPNSGAEDNAGSQYPGIAHLIGGEPRAHQQIHRRPGREQAEKTGERDKPQVVIFGQAAQHMQHLAVTIRPAQ